MKVREKRQIQGKEADTGKRCRDKGKDEKKVEDADKGKDAEQRHTFCTVLFKLFIDSSNYLVTVLLFVFCSPLICFLLYENTILLHWGPYQVS